MKVLLIEPDRVLAEIYYKSLRSQGHEVSVCSTAQAGVLVADQFQPDVVILEIQLVGHSGIEFLYEFRSYPEWQQVPVIIHSNVPSTEFSASLDMLNSQLNVSEYLYKPQTNLKRLLKSVHQNSTITT